MCVLSALYSRVNLACEPRAVHTCRRVLVVPDDAIVTLSTYQPINLMRADCVFAGVQGTVESPSTVSPFKRSPANMASPKHQPKQPLKRQPKQPLKRQPKQPLKQATLAPKMFRRLHHMFCSIVQLQFRGVSSIQSSYNNIIQY